MLLLRQSPGAPDDEIMRADGMLDEEEVPASVYLAVASVSPRATQEQLAAAEVRKLNTIAWLQVASAISNRHTGVASGTADDPQVLVD